MKIAKRLVYCTCRYKLNRKRNLGGGTPLTLNTITIRKYMRLFGLFNENSFLIVAVLLLAVAGFLLWKYAPFWSRFPILVAIILVFVGLFYVNKADLPHEENIEVAQQVFDRESPVLVELYSDF